MTAPAADFVQVYPLPAAPQTTITTTAAPATPSGGWFPGKPTCRGVKKNGAPCQQTEGLSADTQLCLVHDPAREAERGKKKNVRKRRGRGTLNFIRREDLPCGGKLENLEHCAQWAAWLAVNTVTGDLDAAAAREANKAIMTLSMRLERQQGFAKRIKELEDRIKQKTSGART